MDKLSDKVAIVTGAGSGIGRALAIQLHDEAMHVVAADVRADAVEALATQYPAIEPAPLDVTQPAACETLAEGVFARHGAVHLLVNNAGVIGRFAPIWDQDPADWQWALNVNVLGIANMLRAFVPRLRAQNSAAHIVNTASEAAFTSRAFVGVYHASKHAVLALTEALAQELDFEGADIRVSVLCPGGVKTDVLDTARSRPEHLDAIRPAEAGAAALERRYRQNLADAMAPEQVAKVVIEGIRNNRFYLLPHPQVAALPRARADAVEQDRYPQLAETLAAQLRDTPS